MTVDSWACGFLSFGIYHIIYLVIFVADIEVTILVVPQICQENKNSELGFAGVNFNWG